MSVLVNDCFQAGRGVRDHDSRCRRSARHQHTRSGPTHVAQIANHLLLAFPGGSLQFSTTGEPTDFSVITGAGEIGLGTEVTNLIEANDSALIVTGTDKIATLTGRDLDTFQLDVLTAEAGAEPNTAAQIATTVFIDQRGMR